MIDMLKTKYWRCSLAGFMLVVLAACSTTTKQSGGYYKDDGPEANVPANLNQIPSAVPKIEPLAKGPNKPYTALGQSFTPDTSGKPYRAKGLASWYGKKFHGKSTANGERYNMYAMTAAHPTLPIPSYVRVTRLDNNKSVVLRINDRGPFHRGRIIDVSYAAAHQLGMLGPGSAQVLVERIMPDQIRGEKSRSASNQAAAIALLTSPQTQELASLDSDSNPDLNLETDQDPPVATTDATPIAASPMFLQLGAFSDQAKAQSLAAQVTEQVSAQIHAPVQIDRSETDLYRVRIGPFTGRDEAMLAALPVSQATGMTPSLSLP
jgi:rare lipoprotein A